MNLVDANLVSILVTAVAAWVFGAIYCTVLSKPWMAVQGKTLEQRSRTPSPPWRRERLSSWSSSARSSLAGRSTAFFAREHVQRARRHHLGGFMLVRLCAGDSVGWLGAFLIIGAVAGRFGP
jgi:hypothetical protein